MFPSRALMERGSLSPEPSFMRPPGSPVNDPPSSGFTYRVSSERDAQLLEPPSSISKVPGIWAPSQFLIRAPMERDARLQSLFYISSRVPSKGTPPVGSPHRGPSEREMLHF
jgi:hypothetical protein